MIEKKVFQMNLYKSNDTYIVHSYENREEWKSKRIKGIGGSDASTLIGMNPWKDNNTLWKEKKGLIIPKDVLNDAITYGIEAEEPLRKLFELDFPDYEMQYQDNTTLQSVKHPWLLYSPDGLLIEKTTGRKGIWECKTSLINNHAQKEKWNNQIPQNYYIQVLHGLLVTDFDFVVLKAQLKSVWRDDSVHLDTRHYTIERKEIEQDLEWLLEKEIEQYTKYYLNDVEPPTLLPQI